MKNKNIIVSTFITLVSLLMPIALAVTLFSNGDRSFNIIDSLQVFSANLERYDLYTILVKQIVGDDFANLSTFQQNFYFTSLLTDTIPSIANIVDIPVIGAIFGMFINFTVMIASIITIICEFLLKLCSLAMSLLPTLFYIIFGETLNPIF